MMQEYKKEDYELERDGKSYSYTDLYEKGGDGELFELVGGRISQYIGTRVLVKKTLYGTILKHPHLQGSDSNTLVTPYASITSAYYKRLVRKQRYVEISLSMALKYIMEGKPVFYRHSDTKEYVAINDKYLDFNDMDIFDFDDLSRVEFFIHTR